MKRSTVKHAASKRERLPGPSQIPPAGFEPATYGLGSRCSIQLSYEGNDGNGRQSLVQRESADTVVLPGR